MTLSELIAQLQALAAEIGPNAPVLFDPIDSMRLRQVKSTTTARVNSGAINRVVLRGGVPAVLIRNFK
jgi:hypothetical protein